MNLLYRRLTYSFFIIVFLVLTPLIILYTQGYRYSFDHKVVQKTGILIVSSDPKNADIFLNDKKYEDKNTPAKIKNLLPGDYEIKLAKEGYHSWQKQLPIYENSTTFAEKVLLWKKEQPAIIASDLPETYQTSPNNTKLAMINLDQSVATLNLNENIITIGPDLSKYDSLDILNWSNTSKKIIVQGKTSQADKPTYLIINLENLKNKTTILNSSYLPNNPVTIKWDLTSDNTIYSSNDQGIWQTNIFEKEKSLIFETTEVQDFLISAGELYYIKNKQLFYKNLKQDRGSEVLQKLGSNSFIFLTPAGDKLFMLNKEHKELLIIDPNNSTPKLSIPANDIAWLNSETLLAYNEWELWIYNINNNEPELITRMGKPISKAIWHPRGQHIIFVSDAKLKIIELDNRELRTTIALTDIEDINSLNINNSGSRIYFSGKTTEETGFFALDIR